MKSEQQCCRTRRVMRKAREKGNGRQFERCGCELTGRQLDQNLPASSRHQVPSSGLVTPIPGVCITATEPPRLWPASFETGYATRGQPGESSMVGWFHPEQGV